MKSASAAALVTLAVVLSAATSNAALTTANSTYDMLSVFVQNSFGALGEVVLAADDLWLTQTFEWYLKDAETALRAENANYDYYGAQLVNFLHNASTYSDDYALLADRYARQNLSTVSYMTYSAAAYSDVVFDTAELVAAGLENKTLAKWVGGERSAMETSVASGAGALPLSLQMNEFANTLMLNEDVGLAFVLTFAELATNASDEFSIPTEEDFDGDEVSGAGEDASA